MNVFGISYMKSFCARWVLRCFSGPNSPKAAKTGTWLLFSRNQVEYSPQVLLRKIGYLTNIMQYNRIQAWKTWKFLKSWIVFFALFQNCHRYRTDIAHFKATLVLIVESFKTRYFIVLMGNTQTFHQVWKKKKFILCLQIVNPRGLIFRP